MKKYEITIERIAYATYVIEAEDEDQAQELVWQRYDSTDANDCASNNIWDIEEVEE